MLLERYYDDALAQASYLIACEQSGDAIIVDPNRDIERYVRAASARRLRIRYVTETHIHADFLSGSRALAEAAGATLLLSAHGGADWSYRYPQSERTRLVRDGESIGVGKVRLNVLHTPGHTPEHISFVVTDTAVGDLPMGIVTGDFLFVGDVGRPDLLERSAKAVGTMERGAAELYASLQRSADLPDYVQVWPGHGAGSACGKALGAVPQSTLGYERLYNPALQHRSETAFVRWVLADQPEPPPYFAEMKRLNRDGPPPPPRPDKRSPPQLDAEAVVKARAADHWIVDVRGSADFAREHLPGAINIPASNKLPTYAGTVLSYDRPIVLLAKSQDQAAEVTRQLALIGLDRVIGWRAPDVLHDVERDGDAVSIVRAMEPRDLADQLATNGGGPRVIDVRGRPEWNEGHVPQATHIYLGDLQDRMREFQHNEPIVVLCQTGSRSSIAASLLMARGFTDVRNLVGGFHAWRKLGLPVSEDR
jgi:hydroxyacylglutathione hydrolase